MIIEFNKPINNKLFIKKISKKFDKKLNEVEHKKGTFGVILDKVSLISLDLSLGGSRGIT